MRAKARIITPRLVALTEVPRAAERRGSRNKGHRSKGREAPNLTSEPEMLIFFLPSDYRCLENLLWDKFVNALVGGMDEDRF